MRGTSPVCCRFYACASETDLPQARYDVVMPAAVHRALQSIDVNERAYDRRLAVIVRRDHQLEFVAGRTRIDVRPLAAAPVRPHAHERTKSGARISRQHIADDAAVHVIG